MPIFAAPQRRPVWRWRAAALLVVGSVAVVRDAQIGWQSYRAAVTAGAENALGVTRLDVQTRLDTRNPPLSSSPVWLGGWAAPGGYSGGIYAQKMPAARQAGFLEAGVLAGDECVKTTITVRAPAMLGVLRAIGERAEIDIWCHRSGENYNLRRTNIMPDVGFAP
ncbi:MAG: hypothetical protein KGI37_00780 [Alphaproteobacteria bacterium]|nr:hypothetical protein [Alphaproteobacteria bacterium]